MKILFICHNANLTGAPKVGFEIARNLAINNEVVMVLKKDGPLSSFSSFSDSFSRIIKTDTSHEISGYNNNEKLEISKKVLQQEKPDLLYVNSVASSDWCEIGKEYGVPVVLHSHEMKRELLSLESVGLFNRDLSQHVDLLITVSQDAERDIFAACNFPFKRILSSRPGLNFEDIFKQVAKDETPCPVNYLGKRLQSDRPLISMCGIASERKGSDIFFSIAKKLPEYNFLWIGPWTRDQSPGNIALNNYEQTPADNFYITNEVSNPYPYFTKTDVFVLTSREDPNPLVVMEAILLSKVCIGFSATGGSKDLLNSFGVLLHGSVDADRIVSLISKMHFPMSSGYINEERRKLFMAEYNLPFIASSIENEIVSLTQSLKN